jgi:hypothetical protein
MSEAVRRKNALFRSQNLSLRLMLTTFIQRVNLTDSQLQDLPEWIYIDPSSAGQGLQTLSCMRPPRVHLIGTSLMLALCHAEHLVFLGREKLPQHLQDKLPNLRNMKISGVITLEDTEPIDFSLGLDGYREIVRYIYQVFVLKEIEDEALYPGGTPPKRSCAMPEVPSNIEEYKAYLWTVCIEEAESVFGSLYMFTFIWFIEVGSVNGFHPFPLRSLSRQGDITDWKVVWRQAWYQGVVAQLTILSPVILSAFLAGIFF